MNIMADKELVIAFSLASRPKMILGSSLSTTVVHCTSPSPQGYAIACCLHDYFCTYILWFILRSTTKVSFCNLHIISLPYLHPSVTYSKIWTPCQGLTTGGWPVLAYHLNLHTYTLPSPATATSHLFVPHIYQTWLCLKTLELSAPSLFCWFCMQLALSSLRTQLSAQKGPPGFCSQGACCLSYLIYCVGLTSVLSLCTHWLSLLSMI